MTVPTGTVQDVLDWVGDDPARAQEALDAEYAGQNRSTLISQLEAIADKEATPMTETATESPETTDEAVELAPAPEPPEEVLISVGDVSTVVGAVHVRDADVDLTELPTPLEAMVPPGEQPDAEQEPIEAEQVLALQGVTAPNGAIIAVNGHAYAFTPSMVATLKGVVDRMVAGVAI